MNAILNYSKCILESEDEVHSVIACIPCKLHGVNFKENLIFPKMRKLHKIGFNLSSKKHGYNIILSRFAKFKNWFIFYFLKFKFRGIKLNVTKLKKSNYIKKYRR